MSRFYDEGVDMLWYQLLNKTFGNLSIRSANQLHLVLNLWIMDDKDTTNLFKCQIIFGIPIEDIAHILHSFRVWSI